MCISIQRIIQGLVPVIIMSALCACSNAERTTRRADAAMAIGEYQEAASLYRRAYMQTSPVSVLRAGCWPTRWVKLTVHLEMWDAH